ncbi:MAG: endonuclease V [Kofleriaceae bacterium]
MIVCLDVDYRVASVVTACVGFHAWTDAVPAREHAVRSAEPAVPYEPGRFFARELPYLRAALAGFGAPTPIELAIVDGYVWLDAGRPGLGAHLHAAIAVPVIGIAKTHFAGSDAIAVTRGASAAPLFITAAGLDPAVAAAHVVAMHGPIRIPTVIKRADPLARS